MTDDRPRVFSGVAAGLALIGLPFALGTPLSAQERALASPPANQVAGEETVQREPRTVDAEMQDMLDEGVALGCLVLTPPAEYSQVENGTPECAAYIERLRAEMQPQEVAQASDERNEAIGTSPPAVAGEAEAVRTSVATDLRPLLDEGVTMGCLVFTPPSSFEQSEAAGPGCAEYLGRLTDATGIEPTQVSPPEASPPQMEQAAGPMASTPLDRLVDMASNDMKPALLELGRRFEQGRGGVAQDWDRALELYEAAGRTTPERRGLVVRQTEAGAGGGVSRGVLSPRVPGLPEARAAREALEARIAEGQGPSSD